MKACPPFKLRPEIRDDPLDIYKLEFSADGAVLAAGYGDGTARLYNPASGRRLHKLQHSSQHPIPSLSFRNATSAGSVPLLLSVSSVGQVCHWHVSRGSMLHTFTEDNNELYTCTFSPDGTSFLTAGKDMVIRCYDESTNQLLCSLRHGNEETTSGHANRIFSARYRADDANIIASGGWDNTIQIWDIRVGHSVWSYYGPNVCGESLDTVGSYLVVGSWKGTDQIHVYDLRTRDTLAIYDWSKHVPPAASVEEYQAAIDAYLDDCKEEAKNKLRAERIAAYTDQVAALEDEQSGSDSDADRELERKAAKIGMELMLDTSGTEAPWKSKLVANTLETTLIYSVSVSKNPAIPLVSACGSGANEAKVLDYKTGEVLGGVRLPKSGFATAMSPDTRYVAYGGAGYGIWMANIPDPTEAPEPAAPLATTQSAKQATKPSLKNTIRPAPEKQPVGRPTHPVPDKPKAAAGLTKPELPNGQTGTGASAKNLTKMTIPANSQTSSTSSLSGDKGLRSKPQERLGSAKAPGSAGALAPLSGSRVKSQALAPIKKDGEQKASVRKPTK